MPTFAGYNAKVTLGAGVVRAHSFTLNLKTELYDTTHFDQSADNPNDTDRYGQYLSGIFDADLTIDAHWFTEDNPYTTLSIIPATVFAPVVLLLEQVNSAVSAFSFSKMIVESVDHVQAVRDSIHFTARLRNTGRAWTVPTV